MEEKTGNKHIKKYILKAILYIAFVYYIYMYLIGFFTIISVTIFVILNSIFEMLFSNYSEYQFIDLAIIVYFACYIIFSPIVCYILAKIFGIFKYIDKLKNLITKFLVLILISFLSSVILFIKISNNGIDLPLSLHLSLTLFGLIPAYLLYKYFQYLTKKYPTPFEKIGYYCSIEFYKSLFKRKYF